MADLAQRLSQGDPRRFPPDVIEAALANLRPRLANLTEERLRKCFQPGLSLQQMRQLAEALLLYSAELYAPSAAPKPGAKERKDTQPRHPWQIYRELNAACRMHGHVESPTAAQQREWQLFEPLAAAVDASIRALQPHRAVLFRGSAHPVSAHDFPLGTVGCWGGCTSASADRHRAAEFVSKESTLKAQEGCFLMILSDDARSISELSAFPEEQEYLHPLDLELEVCGVLPVSVLRMLNLRIDIVTFKRQGSTLSLELWLKAVKALSFIYNQFLQAYVPSRVKSDPESREVMELLPQIQDFVRSGRQILVLAAKAGVGKTSCSLWLSHRMEEDGVLYLFLSLPTVKQLFRPNALVAHLLQTFGLEGSAEAVQSLRARHLVLILDSLDEVPPPPPEESPTRSLWELQEEFHEWHAQLIVTCRSDHLRDYGLALGAQPEVLYLQEFAEPEIQQYITRRLTGEGGPRAPRAVLPAGGLGVRVYRQMVVAAERLANNFGCCWRPILQCAARPDPQGDTMMVVEGHFERLRSSALWEVLHNPFVLSVAVDLLQGGHDRLEGLTSQGDLYEAWLRWKVAPQPPTLEETGAAMLKMAALAWELHATGRTSAAVGAWGAEGWFRRCPLRLNNYHPQSLFSFQHKSLQEYLAARHLHAQLAAEGEAAGELLQVDLRQDFPVLHFFRDVTRGENPDALVVLDLLAEPLGATPSLAWRWVRPLVQFVIDSRGTDDGSVTASRAANAMTLLVAAGVPLEGLDLHDIRVPGACLQCARLLHTDLRGAGLRGVDLQGAVVDFADLRGADLRDVFAGQLQRTLIPPQQSQAWCVAVSRDGTLAAAGFENRNVYVWSRTTGKLQRTLKGHKGPVFTVAIIDLVDEGRLVVSGSWDATIKVWHLPTGCLQRTFKGHTNHVRSIAIAPSGKFIVSGSWDNTLRVWDLTEVEISVDYDVGFQAIRRASDDYHSGDNDDDAAAGEAAGCTARLPSVANKGPRVCRQESVWRPELLLRSKSGRDSTSAVRVLTGHMGSVTGVAVTRDEVLIVSASNDKTVRVWCQASGQLLRTLEGHTDRVTSVALSSDDTLVVTGSADNTVRIWRLPTGEWLRTLEGHTNCVQSVAISENNGLLVSGSVDKTVRVWRLQTGRLIRALRGHTDFVTGVAVASDQRWAVSASHDGTIRVWRLEAGQLMPPREGHADSVLAVATDAAGEVLVSGSDDRKVCMWNATSGRRFHTLEGHTKTVTSVAMAVDGSLAVSASLDKTLRVWELSTGRLLRILEGHTDLVYSVAMTMSGCAVVSGSEDWTVRAWKLPSGQPLHIFWGHTEGVNSVAVASDGTVVSGSQDMTVRVWNLSSGRLLHTLEGHTSHVTSVAVAALGDVAVSGSADQTLRVWQLSSGRLLHKLEGHTNWVRSVAVAPDGSLAVSGAEDKTVRVWQLSSGLLLQTLSGHSGSVLGAVLDGLADCVVSCSSDKTIRIWRRPAGGTVSANGSSEVFRLNQVIRRFNIDATDILLEGVRVDRSTLLEDSLLHLLRDKRVPIEETVTDPAAATPQRSAPAPTPPPCQSLTSGPGQLP